MEESLIANGVKLIDTHLAQINGRKLVEGNEVTDMLLDIRQHFDRYYFTKKES